MKRNRLFIGLLGLLAISMTSCHRGIGCPSDFSLDVADIVSSLIAVLPL